MSRRWCKGSSNMCVMSVFEYACVTERACMCVYQGPVVVALFPLCSRATSSHTSGVLRLSVPGFPLPSVPSAAYGKAFTVELCKQTVSSLLFSCFTLISTKAAGIKHRRETGDKRHGVSSLCFYPEPPFHRVRAFVHGCKTSMIVHVLHCSPALGIYLKRSTLS